MSVYLDASVLVALLTEDAFSAKADAYFRRGNLQLLLSDFAAAEFASVIARSVRMGQFAKQKARALFADLDDFRLSGVTSVETVPADIRGAEVLLRRLDLPLRAPDALHIAIAQRVGAELATFDGKMAASARALGIPLAAL
ncbi:MAG: type II toxin-antitoxin system VapC family toxin [Rhizomicrobium sp.]